MAQLYHNIPHNHSTEPGNVQFKNIVDPDSEKKADLDLLCFAMPQGDPLLH